MWTARFSECLAREVLIRRISRPDLEGIGLKLVTLNKTEYKRAVLDLVLAGDVLSQIGEISIEKGVEPELSRQELYSLACDVNDVLCIESFSVEDFSAGIVYRYCSNLDRFVKVTPLSQAVLVNLEQTAAGKRGDVRFCLAERAIVDFSVFMRMFDGQPLLANEIIDELASIVRSCSVG